MTLFDLKGRVAVVTGGNGGIGLGMARGLAQAGAAVAIAGRNVKKSEAAAAELAKLGVKTAVLEVDVTDEAACRKMVADTVKPASAGSTSSSTTPASTSASRRTSWRWPSGARSST